MAAAALDALTAAPGGAAADIGEVREAPAGRCWSRPTTAGAGSWTCWSATRCRGSAEAGAHASYDRRLSCRHRSGAPRSRNELSRAFFAREAPASPAPAARCPSGSSGRPAARLRPGPLATDAQHVSVEFVHPVIVGKRALPALDLSLVFRPWLDAICRARRHGHGVRSAGATPPSGALEAAGRRGAMTFALPGEGGTTPCSRRAGVRAPGAHRDPVPHALGDRPRLLRASGAGPRHRPGRVPVSFLGAKSRTAGARGRGRASILMKATDDERSAKVSDARKPSDRGDARALASELARGGKLIIFGNGGSATDANDWAIDCVVPPRDIGRSPPSRSRWSRRRSPRSPTMSAPSRLPAAAHRPGRPDDVGDRHLDQRRLAQRGRGARGSAEAGAPHGGPPGLRRRRDRARGLADHYVVVSSDYIPRIQEVQASIYHIMRELEELDAMIELELSGTPTLPLHPGHAGVAGAGRASFRRIRRRAGGAPGSAWPRRPDSARCRSWWTTGE